MFYAGYYLEISVAEWAEDLEDGEENGRTEKLALMGISRPFEVDHGEASG